jgi:hypothetical protein
MNLLHTVGALIAGESPQHDEEEVISSLSVDIRTVFPVGVERVKSGALAPTAGVSANPGNPIRKVQAKARARHIGRLKRPVGNQSDLWELQSKMRMGRHSWSRMWV